MSADMDVVGVMAAYLPVVSVCTAHSASLDCAGHTLYEAPWWWIPCDPKHVRAILNILNIL